MDDLLNALSPPQFWVWGWLSSRYRQGKSEIITIGQALAPALYSRKQLTRILRGLELKKFLVINHLPANHHEDLVVVIDKRRYLDIGVQVDSTETPMSRQGGFTETPMSRQRVFDPEKRATETPMSKKIRKGNGDGSKASGPTWTPMSGQNCSASASARKEKSLKALAGEKDQKELLKAIIEASPGEREELAQELARIAPMARGRKLSRVAVIYAAVRFLQDGAGANKPAAWVEAVAKKAELRLRQGAPWTGDLSGSGGRLPSRAASGGR